MRQIFGGALLVIAGIAAFIEAHSHRPESEQLCGGRRRFECPEGVPITTVHHGLSETAYDLLRIGGLMRFYALGALFDATRTVGVMCEGRDAIRSLIQDWFGAYEEWEFELEETLDRGNGVVFAAVRQHARATGTTGYVQQREGFVYVWVEGLIARLTIHPYTDIDEARAAAERLVEERAQADA